MPYTLLKLTQNILSDMDSDEVNSIYDTVESLQVASIVVDVLEAEFGNLDLPFFKRVVALESVSDVNRPNYLRYPSAVTSLTDVRYRDFRSNVSVYRHVRYVSPAEFFERQLLLSNGDFTRAIVDGPVTYGIWTDRAPSIYTSIDNSLLIFDAFDSDSEDTLEASRSFALANTSPSEATLDDAYVFPIPDNLYPLLKAEAKATAFLTLKQMANPKADQMARRQRSRMQHSLYRTKEANARSKFDFSRNR